MIDSFAIDRVQNYLGLQTAPEMLFGDNRLYLACPQHNFLLSFSALDCLRLCKIDEQRNRLYSTDAETNSSQTGAQASNQDDGTQEEATQ